MYHADRTDTLAKIPLPAKCDRRGKLESHKPILKLKRWFWWGVETGQQFGASTRAGGEAAGPATGRMPRLSSLDRPSETDATLQEEDHLSKWELPPNLKKKWGVQWLPTGENMKETLLALQHARNGTVMAELGGWASLHNTIGKNKDAFCALLIGAAAAIRSTRNWPKRPVSHCQTGHTFR
jgi:hypothetical protein